MNNLTHGRKCGIVNVEGVGCTYANVEGRDVAGFQPHQ